MTAIHVLPLATAGAPWKWLGIPNHYPHVALDAFVIMPSHVHGIIVIADTGGEGDASGRPYRRRRGTTSAGVGQAVAGPRDYIIDRIGQFVDAGVDEIMSPRSVMPKPHSASTRRSSRPSTAPEPRIPIFA